MSAANEVNSTDLLYCPFCGSSAVSVERNDRYGGFSVVCPICQAEGPYRAWDGSVGATKIAAAAAWNARPGPAATAPPTYEQDNQ